MSLLCKRKKLDDISSPSPLQGVKDLLNRVVSPLKKRKITHDSSKVVSDNSFITSSPKPKMCKSPQKLFRTQFRENKENSSNICTPKTNCPRSNSAPRSVRRSLTFDCEAISKASIITKEMLFSPAFKKSLQRSATAGCLSPRIITPEPSIHHIEAKTIPFMDEENTEEEFSLRTNESLDDFSDCDSENDTVELNIYDTNNYDAMNSLNTSDSSISLEEEEYDHDREALHFIKNVPDVPEAYKQRKAHLPPKRADAPKLTLVLDLDETLVHCETEKLKNPDYKFPITFNEHVYEVWGRKRPFVDAFLTRVAQLFEVVIFTASQQVYADYILDELDNNGVIDHKLFRDSCVCVNGNYLKDLDILGRDLSKVIIVDNAITSFAYQVNNGIPIISWYEDKKDSELMDLLPFLESIADVDDVRPHIEKAFTIQQQIDSL